MDELENLLDNVRTIPYFNAHPTRRTVNFGRGGVNDELQHAMAGAIETNTIVAELQSAHNED